MANFTVEFLPSAEDDLSRIWLAASDRTSVTKADAMIAAILSVDPIGSGTHLSEGLYRLIVDPLAYYYDVDPSRRVVNITNVSHVRS